MTSVLVDSLRRRIRAMNLLWERAVSDVTLDQVNHRERPGVLPIAFSLSHAIRVQDRAIQPYFLGQRPLWEREPWAQQVGVSVDRVGTGVPVAEMELLAFADLEAWRAYQTHVVAATDGVLETIDEAILAEIAIPSLPPGPGFLSLLVGADNPVRKLDVLESWVYQHGLRHLGELEHARSLVGLGGLAG